MECTEGASSLRRNSRLGVYYSILIPDMDNSHVLEASQRGYSLPFTFTAFSSVIMLSAHTLLKNNLDNYPEALKAQIHGFSVLRQ